MRHWAQAGGEGPRQTTQGLMVVFPLMLGLFDGVILTNGGVFRAHALEVIFADSIGVDSEKRDQLFQLGALAGRAGGGWGILQDQRFKASWQSRHW